MRIILTVLIISCCGFSCKNQTNENTISHELLNSVLWMQTAAEYKALCRQAFNTAKNMLDIALKDKEWTAATEQTTAYQNLPPAVILDIDETVLDNSAYEAGLIIDNADYTSTSWTKWCEERRAGSITGAVDFCKYAAARNVQVIYITNRKQIEYNATRDNLLREGFPEPVDDTTLLMRTGSSNKTDRRKTVSEKYRILLLIGDNGGDFLGGFTGASLSDRDSLAFAHRSKWGTQWIILPNPVYGDWEGALFDYRYKLNKSQKINEKYKHLRR